MREIKFRAYDKASGIMFNVQDIQITENGIHCCSAGVDDSYIMGYVGAQVELMQFTGLKDHFKNEIYEGDIVSVATSDYHETTFHEVIYALDRFDFYPSFILKGFESDSNSFSHVFCDGGYSVSVVGNIYDNPELLI